MYRPDDGCSRCGRMVRQISLIADAREACLDDDIRTLEKKLDLARTALKDIAISKPTIFPYYELQNIAIKTLEKI